MNGPSNAMWQRQLGIPGFGPETQRSLSDAHVLLLGLGGVGCPAALYLAAAGVGSITLVDGDVVEPSNLNRQILYGQGDVGRPKVEAAAAALKKLTPGINLHVIPSFIEEPEIDRLVASAGIIVDCFDRNLHRLAVNSSCLRHRKAAVHSYVHNYSGYVIFCPGEGGCLGCLVDTSFPESCESWDNSVIGVAAGQAGIISAAETIGQLTGIGGPSRSRLIFFDLAFMEWSTRPIVRVPLCPACGKGDAI